MATVNFNLLPQCGSVARLIDAAIAALPCLPETERAELTECIRLFETCVVPTAWHTADFAGFIGDNVPDDTVRALMNRFMNDYQITESDWARVEDVCEHYCDMKDKQRPEAAHEVAIVIYTKET